MENFSEAIADYDMKLIPVIDVEWYGDLKSNPPEKEIVLQQVEEMSRGRVRLAAGTLYGALNALSDKGWIRPLPVEAGSRKKEYKLTDNGLKVLIGEIERLRELVNNGDMVLGNALEEPTEGGER